MTNTFYSLDTLGTPQAFLVAFLIGAGFGLALERAGFSSSRRLAGVFYFTDMAVVKVMFSALITAMLGLSYLLAFGWIRLDQIFLMPTVYGAQIVGGILFGIGFVMGGWCPGTAAAGLAAGRVDALVFLAGTIGGSILFNETFAVVSPLYTAGSHGVQMIYDTLGLQRNTFAILFTLVAVAAFWMAEWAEKVRNGRAAYLGSPFLAAFSVALVAAAAGLFGAGTPSLSAPVAPASGATAETLLLTTVDQARDHIEPEELADRLMAGEADVTVVDIRPAAEFGVFHIRGAINVPLPELAAALQPYRNKGLIVLYSNGMTHPAQARDSLQRQGYDNVYLLTDGLQGFRERCLKPVSLRSEPLPAAAAARINAWRVFFWAPGRLTPPVASRAAVPGAAPAMADTTWLAANLHTSGLKIIDLRPQPEYNSAHIPGALSLNVESLRGNVDGVPSMLLPPAMLAAQFSLLGLSPSDTVVLVAGDKLHDATLAGLAFERLGHLTYRILDGGYAKWVQEQRPVDADLPVVTRTAYPVRANADTFTAGFGTVLAQVGAGGRVILDVRPPDYYTGKKSDEARAGHIPGAINRPFTDDVITGTNKTVTFKPVDALAAEYARLIPAKNAEIIVHCRTGHQASQTYFVLKHVLGYPHVRWYDAGWTEWAARTELPVEAPAAATAARP